MNSVLQIQFRNIYVYVARGVGASHCPIYYKLGSSSSITQQIFFDIHKYFARLLGTIFRYKSGKYLEITAASHISTDRRWGEGRSIWPGTVGIVSVSIVWTVTTTLIGRKANSKLSKTCPVKLELEENKLKAVDKNILNYSTDDTTYTNI